MAGFGTVDLASAVCAAGGFGSFGCGVMEPEVAAKTIRALRRLTDKPINVNFFCYVEAKTGLAVTYWPGVMPDALRNRWLCFWAGWTMERAGCPTQPSSPLKTMPLYEEIIAWTPANRFGRPEECAGTAIYLAVAPIIPRCEAMTI